MLKRLYLKDVGGELTAEGRRVRTGLLYRSSGLQNITPEESAAVRGLGIRHIIDLREASAVARRPDRVQAEVMTLLPMGLAAIENLRPADVLLRRVDVNGLFHARLYAETLENHGHSIKQFLNALIEKPTPALVHCAAGKDRTGMLVAMFQLAVGVPRVQVVAGYMAIMPHLEAHFPRRLRFLVRTLGGPPLIYSVIPSYMEGMVDHLGERYGGVDGYLEAIGFEGVDGLRGRFLE